MSEVQIGIFADSFVGLKTVEYLLLNHPTHIKFLVVKDESSLILPLLDRYQMNTVMVYKNVDLVDEVILKEIESYQVDYIFLAWWPYIIKEPVISLPRKGVLNFHPSLLPYNRGKNYNFWTLVEETPFGVTIHFVDKTIDGGDIIFQKGIEKTWEDTGKSLYEKSQSAMIELFQESYLKIVNNDYQRIGQNLSKGTFHHSKELSMASQVILEKEYTARQLLNLLRARTFYPYPGCYFYDDNGKKFEIRIEIKEVSDN